MLFSQTVKLQSNICLLFKFLRDLFCLRCDNSSAVYFAKKAPLYITHGTEASLRWKQLGYTVVMGQGHTDDLGKPLVGMKCGSLRFQ